MTFSRVLGQEAAVATVRRALKLDRLHHAYRFEGPEGVGKELAAFALAQALVCGRPVEGEGCGECDPCRRAVTFSSDEPHVPLHPDVIVVERGLYPPAVLGGDATERNNISVQQVRKVVLSKLAFQPHEARRRIIIVRGAEELSVQSANALLKTLEEPPASTVFVLLTSRPKELLDTIRSRTLSVRFAPLGDATLREILRAKGVAEGLVEHAIALGGGSVSGALALADEEATRERDGFTEAVMRAVESKDSTASLAIAQNKEKDKDVLRDRLVSLSAAFARAAREKEGGGASGAVEAERFSVVLRALREVDRNVAPALVLEGMMLRLRAVAAAG